MIKRQGHERFAWRRGALCWVAGLGLGAALVVPSLISQEPVPAPAVTEAGHAALAAWAEFSILNPVEANAIRQADPAARAAYEQAAFEFLHPKEIEALRRQDPALNRQDAASVAQFLFHASGGK